MEFMIATTPTAGHTGNKVNHNKDSFNLGEQRTGQRADQLLSALRSLLNFLNYKGDLIQWHADHLHNMGEYLNSRT